MSIDSSIVPEIKITPPEGELLYLDPYTGEMTNIDTRVDVQGALSYSGLVYDRSYPPTYNISGGILYVEQEPVDVQTIDIENSIDTSTEPSDLKNTKTNIRKIKPDINSELKRV